jgi:hypothetical protein
VEQIAAQFNDEFISGLDKMFMCGNYGDPAAGMNTQAIYRWFRQKNPTITLGMNTNGGVQGTFWWYELGRIMNREQDYVVFSIDGLDDTNAVYRRGVEWRRVIANVEAFISGGGRAHWDMLVFKHNQHQVDECRDLARLMGFSWFRAKVSRRPMLSGLEAPVNWAQPRSGKKQIRCHALNEQSLYMDCRGRIHPCCWLGNRLKNYVTDFDAVQASWNTNSPEPTCLSTCGTDHDVTAFQDQWQREEKLC